MLTKPVCKALFVVLFFSILAFPEAPAAAKDGTLTPTTEALSAEKIPQNERLQTLEGSKSPWSGQFQATYNGSSLDHPLSESAPNPGKVVPAPVVTASGTFSGRYRFDAVTTAGVGAGVITETPFQGPENTRGSDPYVDVARSFSIGPIRNRLDLSLKYYSSHQYHDLNGYRAGISVFDDSFYELGAGFTLGLTLNAYFNTFDEKGTYSKSQQTDYQFYIDPVLEYRFNRIFTVRAVAALTQTHTRDMKVASEFHAPEPFQMLGFGLSATERVYLYLFAKFFPYGTQPVTAKNTVVGFNTIVNLL